MRRAPAAPHRTQVVIRDLHQRRDLDVDDLQGSFSFSPRPPEHTEGFDALKANLTRS